MKKKDEDNQISELCYSYVHSPFPLTPLILIIRVGTHEKKGK